MRFVWTALGLALAASALADPMKIMPLGDSITYGYPVPGGYRAPLYDMLSSEGYNFQFVGSVTDNPSPGLPSVNHEGHPGWKASDLSVWISTWMAAANPDVVLLHIGTNDISQGASGSTTTTRLNTLMGQITTIKPNVKLFVSSIVPRWDSLEGETQLYNAAIPSLVNRFRGQGYNVNFVDIHSAVTMADLADGIHPNLPGYQKMATQWNSSFTSVVPVPEPATFFTIGLGLAALMFVRRKPL